MNPGAFTIATLNRAQRCTVLTMAKEQLLRSMAVAGPRLRADIRTDINAIDIKIETLERVARREVSS